MKGLSSPPSASRLANPSVSAYRKTLHTPTPTEAEWINPVRSQAVLMSQRSVSLYRSVPVRCTPRNRVLSDEGEKQGGGRRVMEGQPLELLICC